MSCGTKHDSPGMPSSASKLATAQNLDRSLISCKINLCMRLMRGQVKSDMEPSRPVSTTPNLRGNVRASMERLGTVLWVMHNTQGDRASSEFCQNRKIPPPLSLDGKVGRRSPSAALNTSGSYKPSARNTKAVALPSPRNLGKKLIAKQRALVVYLYTTRSST
jgi:hypothetical protein